MTIEELTPTDENIIEAAILKAERTYGDFMQEQKVTLDVRLARTLLEVFRGTDRQKEINKLEMRIESLEDELSDLENVNEQHEDEIKELEKQLAAKST